MNRLTAFFYFLLAGFVLAAGQTSSAQESSISFRIINQKKDPIPFATVLLKEVYDSSRYFTKGADSSGFVQFKVEKGKAYTVRITAVNYQPAEKGILVKYAKENFQFTLLTAGKTMEGVVVTARKPLMKQEDDKIIVEPENLVASSTNGYEVIEKTPGLFIDQDGNIYISSLTPATVQVNGRDMKMSAADIATMLKNLPPNAIARIEVVKTPSAKYDAAASGGVVNVILKKGFRIGMTGSVNTGWQQGEYGNKYVGISLNNNTGKKTSNLNLSYGRRNNYEELKTNRLFAADTILEQDALTIYPASSFYSAYGITWELGKKWELTFDVNLNYNDFHNHSENVNIIRKLSTGQELSNSLNAVKNNGHTLLAGAGIETKYKIDTMGSEWSNDTYYSHADNESSQLFSTQFNIPLIPSTSGDGSADNKRDFFTGRSDLKLKMKKRFTFESGVQATLHHFNNSSTYFRNTNGVRKPDAYRTNSFQYREDIFSLYVQGSKTLGKDFVAKFGTRLENTNMEGHQLIPSDTSFAIHRTDLFPYVYLSKKVMRIAGFELRGYLVYRRSIRRPFYDQLNPFRRYVDEFLTEVGNPSLRPQFTRNYEANISVDERPILAIGLNDTKDIFSSVVYQSDTSRSQAFRTFDNLGKNREWYLRGLGAIPPGGKYFLVIGAQYNHNFYEGVYENKPLSYKKGTWTFFTYQALKLDKRSMLTINGFFRLKGQQQFYELTSFGALNGSVNRKFIKDKLVVTFSINDMFYTNKNDFSIKQGSVNATGSRKADTRRFGINFRYNFGVKKKEENNNMPDIENPDKSN